jgi:DNA polymerase III epsilon subunit-like protein
MKYLSIDIETTGLDKDKNQILEIGAVLDELGSDTPIEDLPKFRAVLIHKEMQINAFCANLHEALWPEILAAKNWMGCENHVFAHYDKDNGKVRESQHNNTHYMTPDLLEHHFYKWIDSVLSRNTGTRLLLEKITINVAGKNAGSFDIPFIEALPNWQGMIRFRRRVFDPASHYARPGDKCLPDLQECLNRAGIDSTVAHTAVDDALDVVRLIRHNHAEIKKFKAAYIGLGK